MEEAVKRKFPKVVAVDFDQALVTNSYPRKPRTDILEYCKKQQKEEGAKIVLWTTRTGKRLDEAITWCNNNGLKLDAVNENLPEVVEAFGEDSRKIFADEYIDNKAVTMYKFSNNLGEETWAEREVRLASKANVEIETAGDAEYINSIYESALKAYRAIEDDGHSGMSMGFTMSILKRLIDGKVLTPIEDSPDIWEPTYSGSTDYQCKRMSSLFKKVNEDGTVSYTDINRVNCTDISEPDAPYYFGLANSIIDKMYPIAMPYFPDGKFHVVCDRFAVKDEVGTTVVAFLYVVTPLRKRVNLNMYFKYEEDKYVPITKEEYEKLKAVNEVK